jgi:hypothetical protein
LDLQDGIQTGCTFGRASDYAGFNGKALGPLRAFLSVSGIDTHTGSQWTQ